MQDHLRSLRRPPTPAEVDAAIKEATQLMIMAVQQSTRDGLIENGANPMQALVAANQNSNAVQPRALERALG